MRNSPRGVAGRSLVARRANSRGRAEETRASVAFFNLLGSDDIAGLLEADQGPTSADVQTFLASGVWVKPSNAVSVEVELVGGGGGGGSGGSYSDPSYFVTGGAGGGGGSANRVLLPADALPATVPVVVGRGGAGGAALSSAGDGMAGGDGSHSAFGSFAFAFGGGGGEGGKVGTTSSILGPYPGGSAGSLANASGITGDIAGGGFSGNQTLTGEAPGDYTGLPGGFSGQGTRDGQLYGNMGPMGGGGGGMWEPPPGIPSRKTGGRGGYNCIAPGAIGGGAGLPGANATMPLAFGGGGGGGGGGASLEEDTEAGSGGRGIAGSGGGGGGAFVGSVGSSGAGGPGGPGYVRVITYRARQANVNGGIITLPQLLSRLAGKFW